MEKQRVWEVRRCQGRLPVVGGEWVYNSRLSEVGGRAEAVGCLGQLRVSLPEVTSLKPGLQLHSSLAQEQGASVLPGFPVPPSH